MSAEVRRRRRRSRIGLWLGGIYLFLTLTVFVLTAATTKPDNVGLDWIPFVDLAGWWWYRINPWLLFAGVPVNAAILYLIGWLIETQWRKTRKDSIGNASVE